MCGISLIINGVQVIDANEDDQQQHSITTTTGDDSINNNNSNKQLTTEQLIEDLKGRLYNRGPDSLKIHQFNLSINNNNKDCNNNNVEITMISSVLGMRGPLTIQPVVDDDGNILMWNGEIFGGYDIGVNDNDTSLLIDRLNRIDHHHHINNNENDTDNIESNSNNIREIVNTLVKIQGPFAFVYWNSKSRRLWFGRDVLGRRSLLVNRSNDRFILSSIGSFPQGIDDSKSLPKWDEVNTFGLYSIQLPSEINNNIVYLERHSWDNSKDKLNIGLTTLDYDNDNDEDENATTTTTTTNITEDQSNNNNNNNNNNKNKENDEIDQLHFYPFGRRIKMTPNYTIGQEKTNSSLEFNYKEDEFIGYRNGLLKELNDSIVRRICNLPPLSISAPNLVRPESQPNASIPLPGRVGVLFSGGLDSMVLAGMVDRNLAQGEPIHLINVAFGEGDDWKEYDKVPDRIAAITGLAELQAINPQRPWYLIKANVSNQRMEWAKRIVYQLSFPAITIMDMTISLALWFAARAEGVIHGNEDNIDSLNLNSYQTSESSSTSTSSSTWIISTSRVLIVGAGADEQLAGYGRHRSAFNRGSWEVLQSELNKDFNRIWKRNLGRDDRVMSSCQREARFPYLDENVIAYLNSVPLSYVCDMVLPQGTGDKRILRCLGRDCIGLTKSASLIKKAIQFGSRSSKQLNKNIPARVTQKCGKEVFSFTKPLYDPATDPNHEKNQKQKEKQVKQIENKKKIKKERNQGTNYKPRENNKQKVKEKEKEKEIDYEINME
ncbi:hypothetical protein DFA_10766 [Cavenderia fasciculata]|uniref:Glutamine amidotransferase type-2 domain-containing protein n=1 Tax=Cavenderia fasciculata TaxID=261658 RepID=F4QBC1_CACFS|nr:uncharacterized protein DFA_10766 [Cavenderia fasciculata]EGG14893.1 hypothetical protein DFA_10766 [Cavenderia fasciculata]|eukprot:XP_004351409.1 hypothetical protein DFA_10766 [Cavenderia fasciculata]